MSVMGVAACDRPPPRMVLDEPPRDSVVHVDAACTGCEVRLTRIGVLGSSADTLQLTYNSVPVLEASGRFVVGPTADMDELATFDTIGAPARAFGHQGDGPGETGGVESVAIWRGDTIVTLEHGRFNFLRGSTGHGRSAARAGSIVSFALLPLLIDGVIVLNTARPGFAPFVIFDSLGTLTTTIGVPDTAQGIAHDEDRRMQILGASRRPHAFWAGSRLYRYQLSLWDLDGENVLTLQPAAAWFVPYDLAALQRQLRRGDQADRPRPMLEAVREVSPGRVWAIHEVAASNWAPGIPPPTIAFQGVRVRSGYNVAARDGMIDVIDANTGRVLLSEWTNIPLHGFINDSLVYANREQDDGGWVIDVYKVALRGQTRGRSALARYPAEPDPTAPGAMYLARDTDLQRRHP